MKDHEIAHLVNELRGIATTYSNAEQLRSRISECVNNALKNSAPLSPDHSGGGAGMVAAEAFAKGFNTLETGGGKYKIIMQFADRDDGWAAYKALSHMTSALDKVKEINQ